jgi:CRP-like cAMP-binding protein
VGHNRAMSPRFVPATVTELSRVELFSSLAGSTLTKLAARMEREEVPPGTRLMTEGEPGERFYVLISGLVGISQEALGPRRLLQPGSYFGEVAAAMDIPRTATVTTMTSCVVASCDRETFDELILPLFKEGQTTENLATDA